MSVSLRAKMRYGKSTLAGTLVERLMETGQFRRASLYVYGMKKEDTIPKYPSSVEIKDKRLIMPNVASMHDEIIIMEDSPRLGIGMQSVWRRVISMMSGQNRIFCVNITQHLHKEYATALDILLDIKSEKRFMNIGEGHNWTGWIDWTSSSKPDVSGVIKALENGISEKLSEHGRPGRKSNANSEYSKCFAWFDSGKTAKEYCVAEKYPPSTKEYQRVFIYQQRWRKARQLNIGIVGKSSESG